MSRCFPFPPPGYEKKSRAEDANLLKKEKKHKKEKKEKEKREDKEKRDKDKSGDKRREKKDKKKDRDQKKDRDKEKKRAHASEESRPLGKIGSQNGDEVVRVKHNSVQEEKHAGQVDSYVGNKISQTTFLPKETKISKLVPEAGRRIEDSGTAKFENFAVALPKRVDGMATQVAWSSETLFEVKEQNKSKKIDERKYNGQGIRHEERFSGSSAVPSSTRVANAAATAIVESGVAGMFKSLENSAERRNETNDEIKQKEGEEKRGSKHKGKNKEKKGRSNDKERDKEKKKEKKETKAKEKEKEKNAVVDKSKEINKDNLLGRHSTNTSQLPDSNIGAAVEENLIKKRKDFEPNGVLHAIDDNRPSKLLRPSSHSLKENGRILEPCLTSTLPPSQSQAVENDLILVNKERKINGIVETHHPPASTKHKSGRQDDHSQPTAIHKKPPHPDSKYLSVVYSVPKVEELSDSDNQDWLFSSNTSSQVMKPKLEGSETEEMPQVWAEAMQIESAEVYALPYVIRY